MAGRQPLTWGSACERAREWSSLRIDGELSLHPALFGYAVCSVTAGSSISCGVGGVVTTPAFTTNTLLLLPLCN